MAKACDKCGKKAMSGNNVSHSNRKTRRSFSVNLHTIRIEENGGTKKVKYCSSCLKKGDYVKAL
ncbi:MAG: 50S ribosomal protein L28 [Candidatus Marinimicrobia bacterium]|nr:50S ribosomal protein L28 [Candidatus Neomarinimicrobiota bacterium]